MIHIGATLNVLQFDYTTLQEHFQKQTCPDLREFADEMQTIEADVLHLKDELDGLRVAPEHNLTRLNLLLDLMKFKMRVQSQGVRFADMRLRCDSLRRAISGS